MTTFLAPPAMWVCEKYQSQLRFLSLFLHGTRSGMHYLMMADLGSYELSLTPMTNIGASAEGAEMTTFFAPPARWACSKWWVENKPTSSHALWNSPNNFYCFKNLVFRIISWKEKPFFVANATETSANLKMVLREGGAKNNNTHAHTGLHAQINSRSNIFFGFFRGQSVFTKVAQNYVHFCPLLEHENGSLINLEIIKVPVPLPSRWWWKHQWIPQRIQLLVLPKQYHWVSSCANTRKAVDHDIGISYDHNGSSKEQLVRIFSQLTGWRRWWRVRQWLVCRQRSSPPPCICRELSRTWTCTPARREKLASCALGWGLSWSPK